LEAVNFGENANLTGSLVGGLAGIRNGLKGIPKKWIEGLVNNVLLRKCFEEFKEDFGKYSPG
jgi:ADP-ribosylglycohydrolase